MNAVNIHHARPEDSIFLAHIMIRAWRSAFRGILSDEILGQYTQFEPCRDLFSQLLTSGVGTMYLAEYGNQPMGLLYWLAESESDTRIEALLTIPEAWGKGVGPALMETALSDIAAAGYKTVHIWPFAENYRARRFYEKQSFTPSGATRQGDALELEYIRTL